MTATQNQATAPSAPFVPPDPMAYAVVMRGYDGPQDPVAMWDLAQTLAKATNIDKTLRGAPANVLMVLLMAKAVDIPMGFAILEFNNIHGSLTESAKLLHMLARRAGHRLVPVHVDEQKAVMDLMLA